MIPRALVSLLVLLSSAPAFASDPLEDVSGTEGWSRQERRASREHPRASELRRRMDLEAEREEELEELEKDRVGFARERSECSWDRAEHARRRRLMAHEAPAPTPRPQKQAPEPLEGSRPPERALEPAAAPARASQATSAEPIPSSPEPPWGPDPAEATLPPWPAEEPARGPLVTGKLFTHLYAPFSTKPLDEPLHQLSASLWVGGKASFGENASVRFTVTGNAFQTGLDSSSEHFQARIREGYFRYRENGWELRVGQQVAPWGNADAYNPIDFLGAKDFTFLASEDELRRLGALSAQAAWTPGSGSSPLTLSAAWTPMTPRSRLLVPSTALPEGVVELDPRPASALLSDSALSLRASYLGRGWDAALVAFRGRSHLPEYELVSVGAAGVEIRQAFHELSAVGAETSLSIEKWIVRFEGAWRFTENRDGSNPLIEPSGLDAAAGVERPIGDRLRVHAQMLWKRYAGWRSPESIEGEDPESQAKRELATANALLRNYQDASRPASTLRLTFTTEDDELEVSAFGSINWIGGDWFLRPSLIWRFAESAALTVGVDYYGGDEQRPFGSLREYRSFFVETRWMF